MMTVAPVGHHTQYIVRSLSRADCPAVARLHLQNLATHFSGLPGERLLQAYYEGVAAGVGGAGFVVDQVGAVAGYSCGIWDAARLRAWLIRQRAGWLLWWGSRQLVLKPRYLVTFLSRVLEREPGRLTQVGYELRPIVVAASARGSGAATALVESLVKDARQRGFIDIFLVTESDNERAKAFYRKSGFRLEKNYKKQNTAYERYRLELVERKAQAEAAH